MEIVKKRARRLDETQCNPGFQGVRFTSSGLHAGVGCAVRTIDQQYEYTQVRTAQATTYRTSSVSHE
jgi:hypothetical protein